MEAKPLGYIFAKPDYLFFFKKLSVCSYKMIPSLGAKEREEGIK